VIELQLEGGRREFTPGETLAGSAQWLFERAPEALELRLLWYTQGRGDRDVGVVQRLRIEAPSAAGSRSFRFDLPRGPWSCSGRLVSVCWVLEAVAKPGRETARCELVLAPHGREVALGMGSE
jgi:hypothetical protein